MIDYCWQCGTSLETPNGANRGYQGAAPTQAFNLADEYDFRNQKQDFSAYQNFSGPRYQKPAAAQSYGGIVLALGAFFLVLLAVTGAGAALVYLTFHKEPVKPPQYERERTVEPVRPGRVETDRSDSDTNRARSSVAAARFDRIWVDYDVTENKRLGMRIHVKFSVDNMKDVDSYLAVHFAKKDGAKLRTTNKKFADRNGQIAVYRALKPGFDDTDYDDLTVFMPYDEFQLGRGKYRLELDADVIRPSGELVDHLTFYDFEYEKFAR